MYLCNCICTRYLQYSSTVRTYMYWCLHHIVCTTYMNCIVLRAGTSFLVHWTTYVVIYNTNFYNATTLKEVLLCLFLYARFYSGAIYPSWMEPRSVFSIDWFSVCNWILMGYGHINNTFVCSKAKITVALLIQLHLFSRQLTRFFKVILEIASEINSDVSQNYVYVNFIL